MLPELRRPGFFEAVGWILRAWVWRWRTSFLLASPFAAFVGASSAILDGLAAAGPARGLDALVVTGLVSFAAFGTLWLAVLIGYPLTLGALALVGARAGLGDRVRSGEIVPRISERGPAAVGAFLLALVAVAAAPAALGLLAAMAFLAFGPVGGVPFFVLAVGALVWPAAFYLVRFSLAVPVAALEDVDVVRALGRSNELVRGGFWWVLGLVAMAVVGGNIAGSMLSAIVVFVLNEGFWAVAVSSTAAALVATSLIGVAGGVIYVARSLPAPETRETVSAVSTGAGEET